MTMGDMVQPTRCFVQTKRKSNDVLTEKHSELVAGFRVDEMSLYMLELHYMSSLQDAKATFSIIESTQCDNENDH